MLYSYVIMLQVSKLLFFHDHCVVGREVLRADELRTKAQILQLLTQLRHGASGLVGSFVRAPSFVG